MIDSLYSVFFGCRHRRTSFPLRPASKPGEPPGETYVVCLDCARRFLYDWEQMRVGVELRAATPLESALPPSDKRSKLRLLAALCTLPLFWVVGKLVFGRKRLVQGKEQDSEPKHGNYGD